MNNFDYTGPYFDAALWSELHGDMRSHTHDCAPQSVHTANGDLQDSNAPHDTASIPVLTTLMGTSTQTNHTYPSVPEAWPMLDSYSRSVAPRLASDTYWSELFPFAGNLTVVTTNQVVNPSSSTTPPAFRNELVCLLEPGPSTDTCTTPFSSSGSGNEGGLSVVATEYGVNSSGATMYPVEWAVNEPTWSISMAPGVVTTSASTAVSTVAFGKRRRDESHGDDTPWPVELHGHKTLTTKRARNGKATGILEARSAARTRRKPAARIPKQVINSEPKEVGSGARKLADPNSQGNHCLPLLGSRFPQGWAEEDADGRLIWVEGSVEEGVGEQRQEQGQGDKLFEIPQDLETGQEALLVTTQADRVRGAVKEIKCRVCPDARLNTWDRFKRHCETAEGHPLRIYFCDGCGDFFARRDSLKRHRENPPSECLGTPPERAEEKRRMTQDTHNEFRAKLERRLGTDEDIGMPFSQMIKNRYPDSSKKRKRGGRG